MKFFEISSHKGERRLGNKGIAFWEKKCYRVGLNLAFGGNRE